MNENAKETSELVLAKIVALRILYTSYKESNYKFLSINSSYQYACQVEIPDCIYVHIAVKYAHLYSKQNLLIHSAVVHLWSKRSGFNLRIGDHADVSAKGRNGDYGEH